MTAIRLSIEMTPASPIFAIGPCHAPRSGTMRAMTKSYVVSGVGCRRREEPFVVPADVQIVFYRERLRPPQISGARTILGELMVAVSVLPDAVAGPGESIAAAFCWTRGTEVPPSGVYRRSTGVLVMDLSNTSALQPVELAHIVGELTNQRAGKLTVIHWLVVPGDVVPVSPNWQLQSPRRLVKSDGSESQHAALADSPSADDWDIAPSEEAVPPGWVTITR